MSETDALSLADLERYGRLWGEGRERRALCPFCGDEHKRDRAHACLAVNTDTGAWTCHRCGRAGLLEEHKTYAAGESASRLSAPMHAQKRARPRPLPPPPEPSPAELEEDARKRARLRRLWAESVPLDAPLAVGAARYLEGRGIPADVASAARVRFSATWGSAVSHTGGPAVLFPMQDEGGRLVAAEGRFMVPPAGVAKAHSAGPKRRGVFLALPGALEADGVTLCEGPITALSIAACGFPALALCGRALPAWLARRLALRAVLLSLDWYEDKAEDKAAAIARELAAVGARVYRLAPPPAAGDWNDYLQAVGLEAMRAELDRAICGALAPPP